MTRKTTANANINNGGTVGGDSSGKDDEVAASGTTAAAAAAAAALKQEREDGFKIQSLLDSFGEVGNGEISGDGEGVGGEDDNNEDGSRDKRRKACYATLTNSVETQNSIFRFLSREGHVKPAANQPDHHHHLRQSAEHDAEVLERLCEVLLSYYRHFFGLQMKGSFTLASVAKELERSRHVVIQYLPHLISIYLQNKLQRSLPRSTGNREPQHQQPPRRFLEAFLLAVYNCEARARSSSSTCSGTSPAAAQPLGTKGTDAPPGLARSSIYHDSTKLEASSVALNQYNQQHQQPGRTKRFRPVAVVNASTRPKVLHLLFHAFNDHVSELGRFGAESFIKAVLRLLSLGYPQPSPRSSSTTFQGQRNSEGIKGAPAAGAAVRVALPPAVLMEILASAHHCVFNGLSTLGGQVVDLVELRAACEGQADVLMVAKAIRNLATTWSGAGSSSPGIRRGLRAATRDAHYAQQSSSEGSPVPGAGGGAWSTAQAMSPGMRLAKQMITNASFRAKKISEDIPKVTDNPTDQTLKLQYMSNMKCITEELGEDFLVQEKVKKVSQGSKSSAAAAAAGTTHLQPPDGSGSHHGGGHQGKGAAASKALLETTAKTKDKLIAKLPNLKAAIHKRSDKGEDSKDSASGSTSLKDKLEEAVPASAAAAAASSSPSAAAGAGAQQGAKKSTDRKEDKVKSDKKKDKKLLFGGNHKAGDQGHLHQQPSSPSVSQQQRLSVLDDVGSLHEVASTNSSNVGYVAAAPSPRASAGDAMTALLVAERSSAPMKPDQGSTTTSAAAAAANVSSSSIAFDTIEKVEELIMMKKLPQNETLAVHSPESGTTIF